MSSGANHHYLECIKAAYEFASGELLNLIKEKYDLMGKLRSIKHYLLLDQVLEPNWHVMHNRLQTAKSIDDVIEYHNFFFENCLRECLLLLSEVLKIPHVVLGKKVGNTGVIAAIQLSTKHNATIEATRHELKALHPNDPQIVVLNQAWSLESKRHYSSSSFFYHENLLIEP
ncbi:gamma-tubulin complex component 2-like isoform X3 [Camellia sinensis]|uniref:gamma-tubulin complex component 2-like isoform X3 n=1 Tax=Camellia sinensis TaxID=4442 RepID=UPI0010357580|nr:gamma-tubulin complex component 2-like isoform X3 [Camellia sinensis]